MWYLQSKQITMKNERGNYKWYVLFILTVVYVFNFMDRQVMILLQESIKTDLSLTDTQLGLLTGLSFAILYTILGIPLARYADTHNRKKLLVVCLTFWSAMTVLSGRAMNFIQMMLTRIGVSAGEAGGMPPSHSILSDYFPAKQRGTVFAIYNAGLYIGILLGFVVAGVLAKNYGWRFAFYALGAPGILLAFVLSFTLKEPIRGQMDGGKVKKINPSFVEVVRFLWRQKSYKYMCLAAGAFAFSSYSLGNFLPPFYMRIHEMDLMTVGVALGLISGIGGIIGTFTGGRMADKLGVKNKRWYFYVPLFSSLLSIIPGLALLFTGDANWALYWAFPYVIFSSAFVGPVYAVGQSLATPNMRAIATAVIVFTINIIGLTCGPMIVGLMSDYLAPEYGVLSLRYAITLNFIGFIIAAFLFWLASTHYESDLEKMELN